MSDDITKFLTRNLSFIKDNITDIDSVLDKLIEDEIIRLEDRSRILLNRNPRLQVHAMLEMVIKKGAYDTFLEALKASGNIHIIERLRNTDLNLEKKDIPKEDVSIGYDQNDGWNALDENIKTEHIDKMEKELQNLQKENNHLRDQQQKVRVELDTKQKKMQELNRDVYASKAQNEKLQGRLALLRNSDKLNERLQYIERELQEKDEVNNKLELEVLDKDREIQQLHLECEQLRQELDKKTNQIYTLNEQMAALRTDLEDARKERYELKLKLDQMNENINDKWNNMLDVLEKRLNIGRRITPRYTSDQKDTTALPSLKPNQISSLRITDNRYSILPKDKLKTRPQPAQTVTPRHVTSNKKTAFISTKSKTFNKFLK